MDTMTAYAIGMANQDKPLMVFDWEKAARLIAERRPLEASAGLRSDWEWTGDTIWRDGKPATDSHTYLASTWAVPELSLDGKVVECYVTHPERAEWDAKTYWPDEAMDIINAATKK